MPVQRINHLRDLPTSQSQSPIKPRPEITGEASVNLSTKASLTFPAEKTVLFPLTTKERTVYKTQSGKKLTAYQWAVYDFVRNIPTGKVVTYKDVSLAVGGSPRSVGTALRNNPFSPYVPCHRVIASNLFVGGFFGEWGKNHKTGQRFYDKIGMLAQEGITFNETGHLLLSEKTLWRAKGVL